MPSPTALAEFAEVWLPHAPDSAVARLAGLLESGSPYLIHGSFARTPPMGCLATQIAWHHPRTRHLGDEAGIVWLTRVAGLNPATSRVLVEWDRPGCHQSFRARLLAECRAELAARVCPATPAAHAEWLLAALPC